MNVTTGVERLAVNVQVCLASLLQHWQRAVLSALGVLVASVAILLLVSIAKGVQADLSRQVADVGVNLLFVLPARVGEDASFPMALAGISRLSDQNVADIRKIAGVVRATPITFVGAGVGSGGHTSDATFVVATEPDWFQMRPWKLRGGRVLSIDDATRPVCVVGSTAAERLFPGRSAIGQEVRWGRERFRIVGVTQDAKTNQGLFPQGFLENAVYVPYALMRARQGQLQINRIVIQTRPDAEPKALVARIERRLGERLDRSSYSVLTSDDLLKLIYTLMGIATWLLVGLTSIGLFVGGVGIMTVMLMSVNERAKEIGIRMSVGARRRDIFQQFLAEAAALAAAGGLGGLALSAAVDVALARWTPLKPLITPGIVGLGLGVCLAVGVLFGLIPAVKAARQDPIVSLRHE